MEFIIKKEGEKFKYYLENVNIPYNKIGDKMLEYSAIAKKNAAADKKKSDRRFTLWVVLTIVSTIALWAVLSWWMILIWWIICFVIMGKTQDSVAWGKTKVLGAVFKFEKASDKKSFEKLNNLFKEIKACAFTHNEEYSYISYGIDGTFRIDPNVLFSKVDGINAFFMPGFLFYNNLEAIEYTHVEVANIDAYGYNYPMLNEVDEEQVIINTWTYTNIDGSKNNIRKDNFESQIIKASKLEFMVNNSGEAKQNIKFSNRELAKKIIEEFKVVFPDIHYRENLIGDRTDHQRLAFLFLLIAGGTEGDVHAKEKEGIVNFVMKTAKLSESAAIKLVEEQSELYTELITASVGFGCHRLWSKEVVELLKVLKDEYNKELCQELYDVAKEIAFADGKVDEGERAVLNSMKDLLDASDAKGKSRVGAIDDLGKKDEINDSGKKSSFN